MLITPELIYLQLQKTGCSHIESLIHHFFCDVKQGGKHYRLPENFVIGSKKILGSIRNPWSWYLSYWSYSCEKKGGPYFRCTAPNSIFNSILDPRLKNTNKCLRRSTMNIYSAAISEVKRPANHWRQLYEDSDNPNNFREWLKLVLDSNRRYDLFQDYGHSPLNSHAGLLTYLYLFLYIRPGELLYKSTINNYDNLVELDQKYNIIDFTIQMENLENDFAQVMVNIGHQIGDDGQEYLYKPGKTNASQRSHSLEYYYDQESIELIQEREKLIISKYGYQFPINYN
jgi:hypothetical protein